jgi:hypothetical protein
MTEGKFADAVTLLSAIVDSNVYSLANSTSQIFGVANEGNSEVLFEVQFVSGLIVDGAVEGSPAGSQFRPSGTTANAKGHNLPTQSFITSYEVVDTRALDYVGVDADINPFFFSTKYEVSVTGPNDGGSDHLVIRYSDVVLKYAEALNETGQLGDALIQLNLIRVRAGLAASTADTESELRAAIKLERRLELFGEGHRWFDLKRYGDAVTVMNTYFTSIGSSTSIDDSKLILPIPQSQVDTDASITQNPGY